MKVKKDGALVLSAKEVDALNVRMFVKRTDVPSGYAPNPLYNDDIKAVHDFVSAWCANANGKAKARTIAYDDLCDAVSDMEDLRDSLRLSRKDFDGVKFSFDPNGQTFPKAYYRRGDPMSTSLTFSYHGKTYTFRAKRNWCRKNSRVRLAEPLPDVILGKLKYSFC